MEVDKDDTFLESECLYSGEAIGPESGDKVKNNTENFTELQSKYEETTKLYNLMSSLQQENNRLKKQIMNFNSEKEEVENRLNFALQSNKELVKKIEDIKNSSTISVQSSTLELHGHIEKLNEKLRSVNKKHSEEIKELNGKIEQLRQTNLSSKSNLSKVVSAVKIFLSRDFENENALIEYLQKNKCKDNFNYEIKTSEYNEEVVNLEQKLQLQKLKRNDLEFQLVLLENDYKEQLSKKDQEIQTLKAKLQSAKNKIKNITSDYECKIDELGSIVKHQEKELERLNSVEPPPEPIIDDNKEALDSALVSLKESRQTINNQNDVISGLKSQIKSLLSQLNQRKSENNNEVEEVFISSLSESSINNEAEHELSLALKEIQSLKVQLNAAIASNVQAESAYKAVKSEAENLKSSIEILEENFDGQKAEMNKLYEDRERLMGLILQQSQIINRIEKTKKDEQVVEVVQPVNEEKSTIVVDISSAPGDLQAMLSSVAQNTEMHIVSRFKHAMNAILHWSSQKQSKYTEELTRYQDGYEKYKSKYDNFIESVNQVLETSHLKDQDLLEKIQNISDKNRDLRASMEAQLASMDILLDKTKTKNPSELLNIIEELTSTAEDFAKRLEDERNSGNAIKKQIKQMKKNFWKISQQHQVEKDSLDNEINRLRDQNLSLQNDIDNTNERNDQLLKQIAQIRQDKEREIDEIKSDYETQLEIIHNNNSDSDSKIMEMQEQMNSQILVAERRLESAISQSNRWEQATKSATEEISKLKKELDDLNQRKDDEILKITEKFTKHMSESEAKHKEAMTILRQKNQDDAAVYENMSQALRQSEKKIQDLISTNQKLVLSHQKSENALKKQIDELERTRKLSDAQMKAKILANEIRYSNDFDELRHKQESKEKDLYSFGMNLFGIFDVNTKIDEYTFKQTLIHVKNEFERMKKQETSIRSLLGVSDSGSIEDALSLTIVKSHSLLL